MKFATKSFVAILSLVVAATAASAASPYAGDYTGTFTVEGIGKINDEGDTIPNQDGTLKLKFDDAGKITGTCNNKQLKAEGTVSGTCTDDGEISVTIKYPEQDASTVTGSVTNPKDGRIKGTLTQKIQKATVVVKIDVKK